MRRELPRALALGALLTPGVALAEEHVALTWDAPPGCPDRAAVLAQVPVAPDGATLRPITARARVTADGPRWRLHLETDDGATRGERDLDADRCDELATATAVILSLALEAQRVTAAPPPPPPQPPPAQPPRPRPPPARAPSPERVAVSLRASFGLRAGLLPEAVPSVSLAAAVHRAWWRVELEATAYGGQRALVATGAGGEFAARGAALRGCAVTRRGRGELRGCAGVEVGVLAGRGVGISDPGAGSSAWAAPSLGAAGAWRVARGLRVTASAEALALLDAPSFTIDGVGAVHAPWPVLVGASLGAELTW